MDKLLNDFLTSLFNVIGVRSAYLLNNRGEILFPQTERLGRSTLNTGGALELVQALGVFELAGEEINEVEGDFLDGKIVIYNSVRLNLPTKLGIHETFLVVLGDKNLNQAHLRLALNVSLSNIIADKKYKKLEQAVKIKKNSVLTKERLSEGDFALIEKMKGLLT